MRNSFLGIADPGGLRALVPETEHAICFLSHRARRTNSVCFWAVIDSSLASVVIRELFRGEHAGALQLVQLLANDIGTILPDTYTREKLLDTA